MSFLKHRPRGKHIKSLWPGSSSTVAASTDHLPHQLESDTRGTLLSRRPSDPTPSIKRQRSTTTLRSTLSDSATPVRVTMVTATITFSGHGVQPPVYVVTSLSTPPWDVLEMSVSKEKTSSGDLIFNRQFGHVPEGTHQYKIRTGASHWVIDEDKETVTDELGNRNNVLHVHPQPPPSEFRIPDNSDAITSSESGPDSLDNCNTLFEYEYRHNSPDVATSEEHLLDDPELLFRHESFDFGPRQEDDCPRVQRGLMSLEESALEQDEDLPLDDLSGKRWAVFEPIADPSSNIAIFNRPASADPVMTKKQTDANEQTEAKGQTTEPSKPFSGAFFGNIGQCVVSCFTGARTSR